VSYGSAPVDSRGKASQQALPYAFHGIQMISAKYDSHKLTGRFEQDDSRSRG